MIDNHDVIVKATGTTSCESDLHPHHGVVMQIQAGDILGV